MSLRESESCLALQQANVVRACEAGFAEAMFFLTMEFCAGGSCRGRRAQPRPAITGDPHQLVPPSSRIMLQESAGSTVVACPSATLMSPKRRGATRSG
jgi:hypothetical protein